MVEKKNIETQTYEENEDENIPKEFEKKIDNKLHKSIYNKSLVKTIFLNKSVVDNVRFFIGSYYSLLHTIIMALGLFVIIFSNDLSSLICLLNILFLDSLSNIIMYDCPLTMLEKSYLGYSFTSTRLEFLQNIGILYTNSRIYDTQLEIIINVSAACIFKILCLCVFRWYGTVKIN